MASRLIGSIILVLCALPVSAQDRAAASLDGAIAGLSAFDYASRMGAARAVRRAPATEAIPALLRTVRTHNDQFIRYRALVLFTSFGDPGTGAVMRDLLTDRNDRLRETAYRWFERHPEPALHDTLLAALEKEQAEFVRPALIRALVAHDDSASVRRTLVMEVGRGFDFFRAAVIEALGEHRAEYAVDAIAPVARLDGPLQDDAVVALGRIGGDAALPVLAGLSPVSPAARPPLEAALCLLGDRCEERIRWLGEIATDQTRADVESAAVTALGVLARAQQPAALTTLLDLAPRSDRLRRNVALAFSSMALREPQSFLRWISNASEDVRSRVTPLLQQAFESLEEDFAEEQFYAAARAGYWAAPEASPARAAAAALIDALGF